MVFADWMTRILAIFTFIFSAVRVIELYEFYMLIKRYYNRLRDCRWHNWKEFLSRLFFETVRFFMFVFAIAFAAVFHFLMSLCYKWPMASWGVSRVSWLD